MSSKLAAELGAHILLFFLVFGMSATVDIGHMKKQMRNSKALGIGLLLQFIILPFAGFCIVKVLDMPAPMGIALLVVTSSPGGSYSNWWCSMFNADLALSVTMTGLSTILSTFMLPLNLLIYASGSYSKEVVRSLDWTALILSLVVVIGGIASGIGCSAWQNSTRFNILANKAGNVAGVALVLYSALVSTTSQDASLWSQNAKFYIGCALPAVIGVCVATFLATKADLDKPERVSVAVEACYQNTAIATSVAITMFTGDNRALAVGVPLYYGIVEAALLACFCLICWKMGWTKAPASENICVVIATSYEVEKARLESPNAIEVVHNANTDDAKDTEDLVFTQTKEGYQVDEEALHESSNAERISDATMESSLPVEGKEIS
eukprot:Nitzschia sp. Nitz4//scaffold10_size219509//203174//204390//NITZ4_001463-RA/size219509-augustus-gene-0.256-mRNA-1//1//CDS//3329533025//4884//frame0